MIKKAAFIGSGLIGTGLAVSCITHGVETVAQTLPPLELCRSRINEGLSFLQEKGVISEAQVDEALKRVTFTASIEEAVAGADFIQESVPDDLGIKRATVAAIEERAKPEAIIATSTSSLSITEIFARARHPERCMGGHPYLPAYLLPLVEITRGEKTGDEYVSRAKAFYTAIGKEPVVLNKESIGFIANRFQSAIHRELIDLVLSGVCSVEDADKALVYSVGLRWGIIGQGVALHLGAAPEGLSEFCKKFGEVNGVPNRRLSALASWNAYPEGWDTILGAGVERELADRDPETGTDIAGVAKWRDNMLVEMLRLHKKL